VTSIYHKADRDLGNSGNEVIETQLRLPNLLIVGVSKAGTTSLFNYLALHPEICPSRTKEPHYFSPIRVGEPPAGDLEQYLANFGKCRDERYRIEGTPVYFYGGLPVIRAIDATLPGVRAIVSLRNPVDRLWSNYQYKVSRGQTGEDGSFEAFVDRCEQVLAAPPDVAARAGSHRALLTGFYVEFIRDWFVELGPRFKVVFFDDLKRDARSVIAGLLEWLGLDPDQLPEIDLVARNVTTQPRNMQLHRLGLKVRGILGVDSGDRGALGRLAVGVYKSLNMRKAVVKMDPQIRGRLEQIYAESNRELGAELAAHGYTDLPEWLKLEATTPRRPADGPAEGEPNARL
jgi:hypothetical protein